ncbi:ferric reductase [Aspergillus taichungensis]|uniref:ferric-chelate reductase (NADPH) n=1 Tax=Aspergillus taichungensis TaxID=482145 RepID=A0A2J5HQU7_9EURO|nr:ferric reductase [Aspergillus taichungensis]
MGVDLLPSGQVHTHTDHPPVNPALGVPLYCLGGVFVLLFFGRACIQYHHRYRLKQALQKNDQARFVRPNQLAASLKKHVFYAPLLSTRHSREFRLLGRFHMGALPLRLETGLLAGYVLLNLIFIVALIDWWQIYKEKMFQLKYAAGHLAVMNSPALVLTAGRNNPLIWLLGVPFDTFNLLHRWVGRVMVVGAIVHMSCVVAGDAREMTMAEITHMLWSRPFYICGMIALISFVVIFFQSLSPIRHAWYEAFLHFHIILAILAFVALWYHLQNLAMQKVLLVTLILWGLDRAGRLGSVIWRNFSKRRTTATVELLPGDVARVDVVMARSWTFRAGQYMYLYIPSLGLWTSHPFSVAWTSSEPVSTDEKRTSGDSFNVLLDPPERTTMSFLIKRRDGFTNKLLGKVNTAEEGRFSATALAEGPFGGLHSLSSYGTVLLIAGGIGITHPMSYIHEFINGIAERAIAVRRVSLVWVVRSLDHLTWIQPWMTFLLNHPVIQVPTDQKDHSYFEFLDLDFSLSIQIFLTKKEAFSPDDEKDNTSDKSPWAQAVPSTVPITITLGKPCFGEIVDDETAQQVGAMAVSVCGPGGMGDDVRRTVRSKQGTTTVDLYEETFSW